MKRNLLFTMSSLMAATMILGPATSHAGLFGRKKETPKTETVQTTKAPVSRQIMEAMVKKVSGNFQQLNVLMSQGQYEAAMTLAKQSLDEARMNTGIDPKSNRREIVVVPADTFAGQYRSLGQSLDSFPMETQNAIMTALESHGGGYFLDLLNLLKRTNLVYIQAFHQVLKKSSVGLLQEDAQKIRKDLQAVRAIPVYLKDPKQKALLMIFDFEIANSDQNYLFNRELKSYLLTMGADLGYQEGFEEGTIDRELKVVIGNMKAEFVRSESAHRDSAVNDQVEMNRGGQENPFENASYRQCYDIVTDTWNTAKAQSYCLESYKQVNYTNKVFLACFRERANTESSATAAMNCSSFGK